MQYDNLHCFKLWLMLYLPYIVEFSVCVDVCAGGPEQRFLTFWLLRTPTESLLEAADP
jgi:hypothetical protein